jgi:hypothetical protein
MTSCRIWAVLLLAVAALPGCGEVDPQLRAEQLIARKRYSPAIVIYNEILAENPDAVSALIGRGRAYTLSRQFEKALADYNRAIELSPDDPEPFYRRAILFEAMGEFGKARLDNETARKLDPQYRQAFADMDSAMRPLSTEEELAEFAASRPVEDETVEQPKAVEPNEADEALAQSIMAPPPLPGNTMTSHFTNQSGRSASVRPTFFDLTQDPFAPPGPESWLTSPLGDASQQSPIWMTPTKSAATTPPAKTNSTASRPGTPASAGNASSSTTQFTPAKNPYVRPPQPVTRSGTASASPPVATTPAPPPPTAGSTARPTGSPFPQPPARKTGR